MSDETPNGNGKSRSPWAAAGTSSAAVTILLGGIGTAVGTAYSEDQRSLDARLKLVEAAMYADAEVRGSVDERLNHIDELAKLNRDRIEAAFLELDTKLQREMNLADATLDEQLNNLDSRLQEEITRNASERRSQLDGIQRELDALAEWRDKTASDRWTKTDQAQFEEQLGLILKPNLP